MVLVEIIESEKGWGQKVEDVKEFENIEEAKNFINEFNKENNLDQVPDWYMYALLK